MTQEERMQIMYEAGRANALELRTAASGLTGTQIIDRELDVPAFSPDKDYTGCPVGTPVADQGQVWTLIQPHNASHYEGRPATLRALWSLCHTTNPKKAKPWVDPLGTSGMYLKDECYLATDGTVYCCLAEQTVYDAVAMPGHWEDVL